MYSEEAALDKDRFMHYRKICLVVYQAKGKGAEPVFYMAT